MQFKITDEAKKAVVKHLSEEGLLDVCINRIDRDRFEITGEYEGLTVVRLDAVKLYAGDSLTVQGMKMVLSLDT